MNGIQPIGVSIFGGILDYLNQNPEAPQQANPALASTMSLPGQAPMQSPVMQPPMMPGQIAPGPMSMDQPAQQGKQGLLSMIGQGITDNLKGRIGNEDELSAGQFGSTALGQWALKSMFGG